MKKQVILFAILSLLFTSCKNKVGYSGHDLAGKVRIERSKASKDAVAVIDIDKEWKLYAGPAAGSIDMSMPVIQGDKPGVFAIPVSNTIRSYFQFVSGKDRAILAERHLPMKGGYNFRDLGGYRTKEGKYVKWGKIFRSDDLHNLTAEDLTYLASIPINTIVDFRAKEESEIAPDQLPSASTRHYALPITPGSLNDTEMYADFDAEQSFGLMIEMNAYFVRNEEAIGQMREFFRLLQDDDNIPIMFHCSAGKDRTGMAAALVLYALGVDDETVMEDYLLSNKYLAGKYDQYIKLQPGIEPMFVVHREFLQAAIDQIRSDHGSIETFLTDVLGVNIKKLRKKFLY